MSLWHRTPPRRGANSSTFRCSQMSFDSSNWGKEKSRASPHLNSHSLGQCLICNWVRILGKTLAGSFPPPHLYLAPNLQFFKCPSQSLRSVCLLRSPGSSASLTQRSLRCCLWPATDLTVESIFTKSWFADGPIKYQNPLAAPRSPLFWRKSSWSLSPGITLGTWLHSFLVSSGEEKVTVKKARNLAPCCSVV